MASVSTMSVDASVQRRFASVVIGAIALVTGGCDSTDAPTLDIRDGGALADDAGAVRIDAANEAGTTVGQDATAHDGEADAHRKPDGVVDAAPSTDPGDPEPDGGAPYEWDLPAGFPQPFVPTGSPMSDEKVALGRRLFYDVSLSGNGTYSCATCHRQELAFTDGRARSIGSTGALHPRSSMSLANVAYATTLTWANPLFLELNRQAMIPLFSDSPIEMGLRTQDEIEQRLQGIAFYRQAFAEAFPGDTEAVTLLNLRKALEAFQRTLLSGNSPYDRWASGERAALNEGALRGLALFQSDRLGCSSCHSGFAFSDHVRSQEAPAPVAPYHNIGLYDLDGAGAYPEPNTGVYEVTLDPKDMGAFKAPSLRNIAVTGPYMHDGSVATLSEVIDVFADGGRNVVSGPFAGDGRKNPLKDRLITGFSITAAEKEDLIEFLESLTDEAFLTDPRFSNPWE